MRRGEPRRQKSDGRHRRGYDPEVQRAHEPATQAGEIVLQASVVDEYLSAPQEELLALLRQPHEPVIPDHQPDAEILLELLDGGRQRRLRDVAGFRGAREVLLARERNEVGQMAD